MSFSRLRESRGYSIVASLVVVAILILVVIVIEAILPPLPQQQSMNAAAAVPAQTLGSVQNIANVADAAAAGTAGAASGGTTGTGTATPTVAECPTKLPADPYITKEGDGTKPQNCACKKIDQKTGKTTIYGTRYKVIPLLQQGNQVTKTQLMDTIPGNGTTPSAGTPIRCEVEVCGSPEQKNCPVRTVTVDGDNVNSANSQLQSELGKASQDSSKDYLRNLATDLAAGNKLPAPISDQTKSNLSSELEAVYKQDKTADMSNCPVDITSGATAVSCGGSASTLQAKDAIENLANTKTCGDTSCPDANAPNNTPAPGVKLNDTSVGGLGAPSNPDDYYVLQKDENGKDVWCNSNNKCQSADTFTPSQSQGGPAGVGGCAGTGPPDANGNCPKVPENKDGNTFQPPPGNGNNGNGGNGNTGNGGNTGGGNSSGGLGGFLSNLLGGNSGNNNNNNNANNTPQSPFGGACNTRYVCSGNTLYYQTQAPLLVSSNPIIVQTQCQTQPMQQCQYGCQAVQNTSGSNSTLSDVGTGLQILSSVLKIFGGGSSNNTPAVNNNLASSCAPTAQQSQNPPPSPYGTGTDGQQCYQPPPQPDPAQCTAGTWKPTSATQNGCVTGYQCVPNGNTTSTTTTTSGPPTAQLSCQPQIADVGTPISFSYACGNATGSTGTGFSTGGALSGIATVAAPTPPAGTNQVSFTLTCVNLGVTASAQCQVQLNKPGIVMITNPKIVKSGESSLIGWVTAGMQSCVVSSPEDQDFTARNANNTSPSGAATTSPITATSNYRLDCTTLAGGTKTATTTVSIATN